MKVTHKLIVRISKEQYERVLRDAERKGFYQVAQYLRWFILNKATESEEKINLIYNMLKEAQNGRT